MNKTFPSCLLILSVPILVLILTSCSPKNSDQHQEQLNEIPNPFILGFFAGDDTIENFSSSNPLAQYLQKELGVTVEIKTATSYSAVVEAMRAKRIHAMQVGAFSYCFASKKAGAEVLAAAVQSESYDPELNPFYFSLILTKKGSGIRSLNDLRGKTISFVDRASTSGHLLPKSLLIENGIDPERDIKQKFAGTHPSSILAVLNDDVDAGATYEVAFHKRMQLIYGKDHQLYPDGKLHKSRTEQELKELYNKASDGDLIILAQSKPIPNTPFAVRKDLPDAFRSQLKKILLNYKFEPNLDEKNDGVLTKWYVDPAVRLGLNHLDEFYDDLRIAAETVLGVNVSR